jgi:aryl-alcohol dehydrogenase-like predicted oxidoreductase
MRYGKLGNIGLIVSGVALGTMQFGGSVFLAELLASASRARSWYRGRG